MKKHPLQITNIRDLVRFNNYVRKNHIKGKVVQNNYCANASSFMEIALALPLESATLIVEEDCEQITNAFIKEFKYV